jgi:hypothetical protein
VLNQSGVTAPLEVESPNSGPTSLRSRGEAEPKLELTEQHEKERWAEIEVYNKPPMAPRLSGLGIEYQLLQIYSRDRGQRSATIRQRKRIMITAEVTRKVLPNEYKRFSF